MERIQNYEILKIAEDSPNAVIYEGRKTGENENVLIKVLKTRFNSAADIARFKQDYKLIVDLDITGIIKIREIISEDDRLILIVENFRGRYLSNYLKEINVFDYESFLKIGVRIAEIMSEFHKKNIIHRNINPNNIIINTADGAIRITGFGIISEIGADTLYTSSNPDQEQFHYISPEQTGRMNRIVDYRTDFYSLGATFYKMITGKPPFETDDSLDIFYSHIAREPIPPNQRRTEIPKVISDIIMKLLSKNPDERYQSAFGISEDLGKCLEMLGAKTGITYFDIAKHDISNKFIIPDKIFGREKELQSLFSAFRRISSTEESLKTELILISGAAGIGKTSLVNYFFPFVTEQNGYFISGKYEQFRSINPYSSIIQAFQKLVKHILTESKEKIDFIKDSLLKALGANGSILTEVIPELELIIGAQPAVVSLGPDETKNRFNIVVERFIGVLCTKEHPVILFLDDLHFADPASFQMIKNLAENINIRHLLIICAYRDIELNENHAFTEVLKDNKVTDEKIIRLTLKELNSGNIKDLLVNFLKCGEAAGNSLAEIIFKKTGGNPFFVKEFLHKLYNENLIEIDSRTGWKWDYEKINAASITDNVIELLTNKINMQPEEVRDLLKICACIGNRFELEILSTIYNKTIDETLVILTEAIDEGFISMSGDKYIFSHNRIYEAVYSLVSEEEKPLMHYGIGRIILNNTKEKDRQYKLLYIVDQLNIGAELIKDSNELEELARLNLQSGKKVKASAAYLPAIYYFKKTISLLEKDCWIKQYELALEVFSEAAETAYLLNDFKAMENYSQEVIKSCKKVSDAVPVYITLFQSTDSRFDFKKTIDTAFIIFKNLGVNIPRKPNKIQVLLIMLKVRFLLMIKKSGILTDLPVMTDPDKLVVSKILTFVSKGSYFLSPDLFKYAVAKQIELSIKYGICDAQITGYLEMASIFSDRMGKIRTGYELGKIALALGKKLNAQVFEGRALTLYYSIIAHWNEPLKSIESKFLNCHKISIETGGNEWAADSLYKYDYIGLVLGNQLNSLEKQISENHKTLEQLKQVQFKEFHKIIWQAVLNLNGKSGSLGVLSGEIMDEKQMISSWEESNSRGILGQFYIIRLMLKYIFSDYQSAIVDANEAGKYLGSIVGFFSVRDFAFYSSLNGLAIYSKADFRTKYRIRQRVWRNLKKFRKWTRYAPMNNEHRITLIKAEQARVNNDRKAEFFYDLAAEQSNKNNYFIEEAISYELAGKYYLNRDNMTRAEFYINKAYDCYRKWGAFAKIKQMQDLYYKILRQADILPPSMNQTSVKPASASGLIDINTIIKASQIMSREMLLKNLLEKMMNIVMENAGAQKGFMILEDNEKYFVEAEGYIDNEEVNTMESIPLESHTGLAVSIVNFVIRTSEKIILNDVSSGTDFSGDPYIIKNKPRSILCMPVLNSGKLTGVLYLENNAVTNAFTQERLEILNILSSQMAISIDNAKFYKRLEELVAKRTEELKSSEKRFKDVAYSSADWIWETNLDGEYTFCSEKVEEILGYKPEELIGKKVLYLMPQEEKEKVQKSLDEFKEKDITLKGFENWLMTKSGKKIYVSTNGLSIYDDNGNITGYRGIDKDITERKLDEMKIQEIMDELSRSNSELQKFAYTVSHDLQEPLRKIQKFGDRLKENANVSSDEKSMDYLSRMQSASKRMQALITGLLEFSRITTRAQEFRNVNLNKIVNEVISDLEVGINETKAEIIVGDLPEISADPLQMRQLFQNLIGNALKFHKKEVKPVIKINELKNASQDHFHLSVEDNGIGIEEKNFDKIFEVFQRVHGRFDYEGSGIGLAVCKKIVERHGGEIKVESAFDQGSKFLISIKKDINK